MSKAAVEREQAVKHSQRASRRAPAETSISMRVSRNTLDLIDDAAGIAGKSRTEFMLECVRRQAVDVLLDQRLFMLDDDRHAAFVHALDNPPAPGPKLKALMRKTPAWET